MTVDYIQVLPFSLLLGLSLAICSFLVLTKNLHLHRSARGHHGSAIQSAHQLPTTRIGGVGVIIVLITAFLVVTPEAYKAEFALFSLSLVPVFVAGLAEDIGCEIAPKWRLLAAMLSSILAILLLGMWVSRAGVPYVDAVIAFAPVGIALTIFTSVGICNAFNLIDGINGLAGVTGIVTAVGLSVIAQRAGEPSLAIVVLFIVPALLGFLVLNFPFGKIFLGDAGAYSLGHFLAWVAIILMARVDNVSTFAIVLVFFWPIADTFLAMYRRQKNGKQTTQPDRLHFHQLVMRALEICCVGRVNRHYSNPLTTVVLTPFIVMPVIIGVVLWDKPLAAAIALAIFASLFFGSFQLGLFVAKKRPALLKRGFNKANIFKQWWRK